MKGEGAYKCAEISVISFIATIATLVKSICVAKTTFGHPLRPRERLHADKITVTASVFLVRSQEASIRIHSI
uniref:Secreted protein n=1 Tax=Steinernema glaseri TaxID=37863 RepID=A0A1I7ZVX9_9BILA